MLQITFLSIYVMVGSKNTAKKGFCLLLRPSILQLADMFENASGWGLERTFAKWVDQQPWRHCLPPVFQLLDYIYVDLDLDIDRYTYIYIYIYICLCRFAIFECWCQNTSYSGKDRFCYLMRSRCK